MKALNLLALTAALFATLSPASAAPWLTDLAKAQAQARADNKAVLINFTGSDWCGWCIRLKREVFASPEFAAYADKNLVLVEVDFPERKAQTPALKRANEALSARFRVEGYPTLVVLDSLGKETGRLDYDPDGAKSFLNRLAALTGRRHDPAPVAALKKSEATLRNAVAKRGEGAAPARELSAGESAPAAASPPYPALVLKGISGPKSRRMAMINNQTLSAGEAAHVRLGEKQITVRCLEVREKSVLLAVEGEASHRELKMRAGL